MNKEKVTPETSEKDVMPALANVIGRYDKEVFTEAPALAQQMFEELMCTEYGDSLRYRERIIMMLSMIRDFGSAIEPFSPDFLLMATTNTHS